MVTGWLSAQAIARSMSACSVKGSYQVVWVGARPAQGALAVAFSTWTPTSWAWQRAMRASQSRRKSGMV